MAAQGELFAMDLPGRLVLLSRQGSRLAGFWMDVGQPPDYLTGMCMFLHGNHRVPESLPEGTTVVGNVLIVSCVCPLVLLVMPIRTPASRLARTAASVPM
jgi:NDP-sugar pyrophosphorylase family protein